MSNTVAAQSVFLTLVRSIREMSRARLLIDSIRSFGGDWSDCPIWLFETLSPLDHSPAAQSPCASLESAGVKVLPLNVPDAVRRYDFGDKVYACAQAEAMAAGVQSLIWADSGVLFIQPPRLYDLGASFDAAVRPVHIKNVGLLATEPRSTTILTICTRLSHATGVLRRLTIWCAWRMKNTRSIPLS